MLNTYEDVKKYLESFIRPILFQKITTVDGKESDPLDRFRFLLKNLGDPQNNFPAVHVSGTSGKGSTSYLISKILTTSGYKTGLSLSPHLQKINERMQVNNIEVSDRRLVSYVNFLIPVITKMKKLPIGEPSYFEILLAIAFLYFSDEKVDIAVIEVGIEGKYDATHMVKSVLIILTNISLDHTAILGDTEEKIAHEAVSILRTGVPLITAVDNFKIKQIVNKKAKETSSPVIIINKSFITKSSSSINGSHFSYTSQNGELRDAFLGLRGEYQIINAVTSLEAAFILRKQGYKLPDSSIRNAFSNADFPGRFENITLEEGSKKELVVLDGAHNKAKMEAFLSSLGQLYPEVNKTFVVAFKKDKEIENLIKMIRKVAEIIIVTEFKQSSDLFVKAGMTTGEIKSRLEAFPELQQNILYIPNLRLACGKARELAIKHKGITVVTGSLYLVGEVRSILNT